MHNSFQYRSSKRLGRIRSGFTTPAVAIAMLVGMMGLALVLDRIWLETAQLELGNAAEAAALAAAAELVNDELLLTRDTADLRINNARQVAGWIASVNAVGGTPVTLNTDTDGDIRFGNLVRESQGIRFEESEQNPHSVVVTAMRTRSNNNPVALFVAGATGISFGDVAVRVEASVDNCVIGLRPIAGAPIPALPVAIWKVDPTGQHTDTWNVAIEARSGTDKYGYDSQTHSVYGGGDGIPELVIRSSGRLGSHRKSNVRVLDIGTELNDAKLTKQFESGISAEDVQGLGGQLILNEGSPLTFDSTPKFDESNYSAFHKIIGERRICFLYSSSASVAELSGEKAICTEIVGVRIMAVSGYADGTYAVVVQPSIITTRTALLSDELANRGSKSTSDIVQTSIDNHQETDRETETVSCPGKCSVSNPYVYKLRLTQ